MHRFTVLLQNPSGAAVVGAQVTAKQKDTGSLHTTISGGDGSFILPGLPVGDYSLEVSGAGFKKYIQSGLVLQVGQNVQVNIPLTVGSVSSEVQVSAGRCRTRPSFGTYRYGLTDQPQCGAVGQPGPGGRIAQGQALHTGDAADSGR